MNSKPITEVQANENIQNILKDAVEKNVAVSQALLYVHSPENNFEGTFTYGDLNGERIDDKQQFHVASVGKAFTATLIGQLVDEGKLSLDDKIISHLGKDVLEGLFVVDGLDYSDQVTVLQLLNHTSGAADYFGDADEEDRTIVDLMIEMPDQYYTPLDLIAYSRENQKAVGKPGDQYHYSDTGYILLGLLIEQVSEERFHDNLHNRIFNPLGMGDTYLTFYSEPSNQKGNMADIWLKGHNLSEAQSLSIDWSGGGLVSTLHDLTVFIEALYEGDLVSEATLKDLNQFEHTFVKGIQYGGGFMEFHFGEFFPTLKSLPKLKGHIGVLGTQMLYDPQTKTTYIASFGSTDYTEKSIVKMIEVLSNIYRVK